MSNKYVNQINKKSIMDCYTQIDDNIYKQYCALYSDITRYESYKNNLFCYFQGWQVELENNPE